jgi:hypothetical protein
MIIILNEKRIYKNALEAVSSGTASFFRAAAIGLHNAVTFFRETGIIFESVL